MKVYILDGVKSVGGSGPSRPSRGLIRDSSFDSIPTQELARELLGI